MSDIPTMLTVTDVAAQLGVARSTVYLLPIKWVKVGRGRRYDPREIELYLALNARGRTMARAS